MFLASLTVATHRSSAREDQVVKMSLGRDALRSLIRRLFVICLPHFEPSKELCITSSAQILQLKLQCGKFGSGEVVDFLSRNVQVLRDVGAEGQLPKGSLHLKQGDPPGYSEVQHRCHWFCSM